MRRHLVIAVIALASAGPASAGDPGHPTVVELFQSQGCSSCPPANANLNAIADRPDLLPLNFAVTYWDRLGWKDTFAKPAFTDRQWDYARAGRRGEVSTPQMIVNGRGVLVGSDRARVAAALKTYDRGASGPAIARSGNSLAVGKAAAPRPASVWLVWYDPRLHNVPVRAGENGGRTLPHRNMVRGLQLLGPWSGALATYRLPPAPDRAWRGAVLVQDGKGGPIVAASRI